MAENPWNLLYYGDNLDVLRRHVEDESVDLIYLDPPFNSMDDPTTQMRKEAASAGFYTSPWGKHPRLQILTIDDLLTGKAINRPPAQTSATFKRAPKAQTKGAKPQSLDLSPDDDEQPF